MVTTCRPVRRLAGRDLEPEATLFRVLADPHRLRLLAILARADEDVCVCDLNESVPLLQPTVSHHLRVLKEAGLVECERRGTWVYYRLASDAGKRLEKALDVVTPRKVPA